MTIVRFGRNRGAGIIVHGADPVLDRRRSALTYRELEILTLVFRGLTNSQIGRELGLSEGTVRIHVSNILVKLEVKRRTEAVAVALKRGLIRPDP